MLIAKALPGKDKTTIHTYTEFGLNAKNTWK